MVIIQGGGRFQRLAGARAFLAQSTRLCLLRFTQVRAAASIALYNAMVNHHGELCVVIFRVVMLRSPYYA